MEETKKKEKLKEICAVILTHKQLQYQKIIDELDDLLKQAIELDKQVKLYQNKYQNAIEDKSVILYPDDIGYYQWLIGQVKSLNYKTFEKQENFKGLGKGLFAYELGK